MPVIDGDWFFSHTAQFFLNGAETLLTTHWRPLMHSNPPVDWAAYIAAFNSAAEGITELHQQYAAALSEDVSGIIWISQLVFPQRYVRDIYMTGSNVGTVASPALPQNVATTITLRGERSLRTERGTKHIGGVPSTSVADGYVTAAGKILMENLAGSLQNAFDFDVSGVNYGAQPVIYHRADPTMSTDVNNSVIGLTSRILRRRTVGYGS